MRCLIVFFLLFLPTALRADQPNADKPNVVIVLADDQTWNDSGCYGNRDVKTPNIDQLAAAGMRFTRCFTATAMCAPTRQQLYTGVFPIRNGAYPNHSKVKVGTRSIVHHFRQIGYRVGLSGKKHFGPEESFPFENLTTNGDLNLPKIQEFVKRDDSQPFVLVVTSHSPHLPWSEGDTTKYDAEKLTVPSYLVDLPETREALTNYYAEITDFDREVGGVMKAIDDNGYRDETIFIYTSEQGAQFPHGKWTCYDNGLRTALIVRWPGHIKPGSVSSAMVQYVDILPTLLDAAGVESTTIDTGLPGAPKGGSGFDGSSFLPVLLEGNESHRDYVYGAHTTRGIIDGTWIYPIRSVRSRKFKLIWNPNHKAKFQNVLTTTKGKSDYWTAWKKAAEAGDEHARKLVDIYESRPEYEFYDLETDPDESHNLADNPAYSKPIQKMKAELSTWMEQQGDEGIATEDAAKPHRTQKRPDSQNAR
ncbi:MAG: sulfatase [Planctomycetaceae bacterium]|nr:sulfatase [Planctomycetaceae bacterium]